MWQETSDKCSPVAKESGKSSDGGGDEEIVNQKPGCQRADRKLHPRAGKW